MKALLWFIVLGLITVGLVTWLPFWIVLALMLALYIWIERLPKPGDDYRD